MVAAQPRGAMVGKTYSVASFQNYEENLGNDVGRRLHSGQGWDSHCARRRWAP